MGDLIPRQDVDRFEGRIAQIVQASQDVEIHTDRQFLEANSMLRQVNELYKTICRMKDKDVKPNYVPAVPEPRTTLADMSKAKKMLGWELKTTLEEGLERMVR